MRGEDGFSRRRESCRKDRRGWPSRAGRAECAEGKASVGFQGKSEDGEAFRDERRRRKTRRGKRGERESVSKGEQRTRPLLQEDLKQDGSTEVTGNVERSKDSLKQERESGAMKKQGGRGRDQLRLELRRREGGGAKKSELTSAGCCRIFFTQARSARLRC